MTDQQIPLPIIDSHIHLYAASHLPDLAWTSNLPNDHILKRQNSVEQYRAATQSQKNLLGFVFVEADRKSGLSEDGWTDPLKEIDFLRRIASGNPEGGEGHTAEDRNLVKGVVAWAPLPAGEDKLNTYLQKIGCEEYLRQKAGLLRGFRYLLQDKPKGTALKLETLQGLMLLQAVGTKAFDVGVDHRSGGQWQLEEATEMLTKFYAETDKRPKESDKLNIVLNHFCKPNLRLTSDEIRTDHIDFTDWQSCIEKLANFPTTYMKLSGLFSELPPQSTEHSTPVAELVELTRPWMDVVFRCFGPWRIMFGSDWPVCNVSGPGAQGSWSHWVNFVAAVLEDRGLPHVEKARVWAGTAKEAYGLDVELPEI